MPIQACQTQLSGELEERLAGINKLKEKLEDREARLQEHKRNIQTDILSGELTETEVTEHGRQTITEDVRQQRQEMETLQTGLRRDIHELAETRQRLERKGQELADKEQQRKTDENNHQLQQLLQ